MEHTNDTTALAFMGDAVYEVYIRRHVMDSGIVRVDKLHEKTVAYVNAASQALAMKEILPELPDDLVALVKRARNHKSVSPPKNQDPIDYKWATALETLVGHLYFEGDAKMLDRVMKRAIDSIEIAAAIGDGARRYKEEK